MYNLNINQAIPISTLRQMRIDGLDLAISKMTMPYMKTQSRPLLLHNPLKLNSIA